MEYQHKSRFNIWIRTIALILVLAFLWQDLVWANPDFADPKNTLQVRTLPTGEDTASAFKRFATAYLNNAIHGNPQHASFYAVRSLMGDIIGRALKEGLSTKDIPRIVEDAYHGTIRVIFHDGDEILFYNPQIEIDTDETPDLLGLPGKEVVADIDINRYLRQQFLAKRKTTTGSKKGERQNKYLDRDLYNAAQEFDIELPKAEKASPMTYKGALISAMVSMAGTTLLSSLCGINSVVTLVGLIVTGLFLASCFLPQLAWYALSAYEVRTGNDEFREIIEQDDDIEIANTEDGIHALNEVNKALKIETLSLGQKIVLKILQIFLYVLWPFIMLGHEIIGHKWLGIPDKGKLHSLAYLAQAALPVSIIVGLAVFFYKRKRQITQESEQIKRDESEKAIILDPQSTLLIEVHNRRDYGGSTRLSRRKGITAGTGVIMMSELDFPDRCESVEEQHPSCLVVPSKQGEIPERVFKTLRAKRGRINFVLSGRFYERCITKGTLNSIVEWQKARGIEVSCHFVGDQIKIWATPGEKATKLFASFTRKYFRHRNVEYARLIKDGVKVAAYLDGSLIDTNCKKGEKPQIKLYYWTTTDRFKSGITQPTQSRLVAIETHTVEPGRILSEIKAKIPVDDELVVARKGEPVSERTIRASGKDLHRDSWGRVSPEWLDAIFKNQKHLSFIITGGGWGICHLDTFKSIVEKVNSERKKGRAVKTAFYFPREYIWGYLGEPEDWVDSLGAYTSFLDECGISYTVYLEGEQRYSNCNYKDPQIEIFLSEELPAAEIRQRAEMPAAPKVLMLWGRSPLFQPHLGLNEEDREKFANFSPIKKIIIFVSGPLIGNIILPFLVSSLALAIGFAGVNLGILPLTWVRYTFYVLCGFIALSLFNAIGNLIPFKIKVSPSLLVINTILFVVILPISLPLSYLHELGHVIAARLLGLKSAGVSYSGEGFSRRNIGKYMKGDGYQIFEQLGFFAPKNGKQKKTDTSAQARIANLIPERSEYSWVNWLIRIPFIPAILAHELAHYIYAKIKGIVLESVNLLSDVTPKIEKDRGPPPAGFYLAGPIANIIFASLSLIALHLFSNNPYAFWISFYLIAANLVLLAAELTSKKGDFYKTSLAKPRRPRVGFLKIRALVITAVILIVVGFANPVYAAIKGGMLEDLGASPQLISTIIPVVSWGTFILGILLTYFIIWQIIEGFRSVRGKKDIPGLLSEKEQRQNGQKSRYPLYEYISISKENTGDIKTIERTDGLKDAIRNAAEETNHRRSFYLLYHLDTKSGKNVADGIVELRATDGIMQVIITKAKGARLRRLSEEFIIEEILSRKPTSIVFEKKFINEGRMAYLLPHHVKSAQSPHGEKLMQKASKKLGIDIENPKYIHYVVKRFGFRERRTLYFAALKFNRTFRVGDIFWWFQHYFNQLIVGLVYASILVYASQMHILTIHNFIAHISSILLISIFISPIAAKLIAKIVRERRDIRSPEKGHAWQRKVQNQKVIDKLLRFFLMIAFVRILFRATHFLLIPKTAFLGMVGSGLLFNFSPFTYLTLFLLHWFLTTIFGQFINTHWAETVRGTLQTDEKAVRAGFSRQYDVITNFGAVFGRIITAAGLTIGLGIFGIGWHNLVIPLVLVASLISVASGFILPILGKSYGLYLEIDKSDFVRLPNGNLRFGPNAEIEIAPEAKKLEKEKIRPIKRDDGASWLPWLENLNVKIICKTKTEPQIDSRRGYLVIKIDKSTPRIVLKKAIGRVSEDRDVRKQAVRDEQGKIIGWEIIFCPKEKDKIPATETSAVTEKSEPPNMADRDEEDRQSSDKDQRADHMTAFGALLTGFLTFLAIRLVMVYVPGVPYEIYAAGLITSMLFFVSILARNPQGIIADTDSFYQFDATWRKIKETSSPLKKSLFLFRLVPLVILYPFVMIFHEWFGHKQLGLGMTRVQHNLVYAIQAFITFSILTLGLHAVFYDWRLPVAIGIITGVSAIMFYAVAKTREGTDRRRHSGILKLVSYLSLFAILIAGLTGIVVSHKPRERELPEVYYIRPSRRHATPSETPKVVPEMSEYDEWLREQQSMVKRKEEAKISKAMKIACDHRRSTNDCLTNAEKGFRLLENYLSDFENRRLQLTTESINNMLSELYGAMMDRWSKERENRTLLPRNERRIIHILKKIHEINEQEPLKRKPKKKLEADSEWKEDAQIRIESKTPGPKAPNIAHGDKAEFHKKSMNIKLWAFIVALLTELVVIEPRISPLYIACLFLMVIPLAYIHEYGHKTAFNWACRRAKVTHYKPRILRYFGLIPHALEYDGQVYNKLPKSSKALIDISGALANLFGGILFFVLIFTTNIPEVAVIVYAGLIVSFGGVTAMSYGDYLSLARLILGKDRPDMLPDSRGTPLNGNSREFVVFGDIFVTAGNFTYRVWREEDEIKVQRYNRSGTEAIDEVRTVGSEEYLIGRELDCDYTVNDRHLSRRHFSVRAGPIDKSGRYTLEITDHGSKNGTFVDYTTNKPATTQPVQDKDVEEELPKEGPAKTQLTPPKPTPEKPEPPNMADEKEEDIIDEHWRALRTTEMDRFTTTQKLQERGFQIIPLRLGQISLIDCGYTLREKLLEYPELSLDYTGTVGVVFQLIYIIENIFQRRECFPATVAFRVVNTREGVCLEVVILDSGEGFADVNKDGMPDIEEAVRPGRGSYDGRGNEGAALDMATRYFDEVEITSNGWIWQKGTSGLRQVDSPQGSKIVVRKYFGRAQPKPKGSKSDALGGDKAEPPEKPEAPNMADEEEISMQPAERPYRDLHTPKVISDNSRRIIPLLVNALMVWAERKEGEEIVLLLDMPPVESQRVRDLIEDCIIKPLQRINGNNGDLGRILKNLTVATSDDISTIERRVSRGVLRSENVIIVTDGLSLGKFDKFENSFITALDYSALNPAGGFDEESYYYPYVEAAFFALIRALGASDCSEDRALFEKYKERLWRWYRQIPNVKELTEDELMALCFDDEGNPRKRVIFMLIPDAAKVNPDELRTLYERIEKLIRSA